MSIIALAALSFTSCVKKDFDAPPDQTKYDPNLPVNATVQMVKGLLDPNYPNAAVPAVKIDSDWTVAGIIVADDKSGNFYKQIVIQDSTAGISLLLDANSLYNDYPVGRKVYVKLKGLYIGTYRSLPQLGYNLDGTNSLNGIPSSLISKFIVKATFPNTVTPIALTMTQLNANKAKYTNCLVSIPNCEFQFSDVENGASYADPAPSSGTSRFVSDCAGSLELRTSGYSSFQSYKIPGGNGTITGVFTVYNNSSQMVIRDTSDVKFYNPVRCDGNVVIDPARVLYRETFETVTSNNATLNIAGMVNFAETGNKPYQQGIFSNDKFAKISGFSTGQAVIKSWLITPAINLAGAGNPKLSFRTLDGFDNGATLKVYISTNYSGTGNPTSATWTPLTGYTIANGSTTGYAPDWTASGDVSLAGNSGTVYIAFVYEGADPSGTSSDKTTTFELDNITVLKD